MLAQAAARCGARRPIAKRPWQSFAGRRPSLPSNIALSTPCIYRTRSMMTDDHLTQSTSHHSDIPFQIPEDGFSALSLPDTSKPLVLQQPEQVELQRYRMDLDMIGGDLSEILPMLYACLHIGKLDRAAKIIQRIKKTKDLTHPEMLKLHHDLIKALSTQMSAGQVSDVDIHSWFESEVLREGHTPNLEMIAWMLKGTLHSAAAASTTTRLVQRYIGLVSSDEALDILSMEDILTGDEVKQICSLVPAYKQFLESEGVNFDGEEVDDIEQISETSRMIDITDFEEVRSTKQKGLGLKSLKEALSLFSRDFGTNIADMSPEALKERQLQLEDDAVTSAMNRWKDDNEDRAKMGIDGSLRSKSVGDLMWKWHQALTKFIEEKLATTNEAESKREFSRSPSEVQLLSIAPYLGYLSVDRLAAVTILTTMTTLTTSIAKGLPLSKALPKLGNAVEDESFLEAMRGEKSKAARDQHKKHRQKNDIRSQLLKMKSARRESQKETFRGARKINLQGVEISEDSWPAQVKAKIGAFLTRALVETSKVAVTRHDPVTGEEVTQQQPAFIHAHQYRQGRKIGVILANSTLHEMLQRAPVGSLLAKHLPMIVPPEPWTEFDKGGFFRSKVKMLRVKNGDKDQLDYAHAAVASGDMTQTRKGLDILGKTPWRINRPVFQIMLEAWNSGEEIANLAPENPEYVMPPEPTRSADPTERRLWLREIKKLENERSGLHSQRCFQNFQLEIARALRDHTFYFPHNIDFRGRAYPIPPYLNHMGADHCRGLLSFGKGKRLGATGLRWLKIHLANVFGFDKASLSEREAFADKHMEQIRDSAINGLKGKKWWLDAEEPWQCLATCVEITNALDSGDPESFISHLPIHQDGTCNGLQHYAALGGDEWGARQVNLEPGDRPADIYSAVAELVKESIKQDEAKGDILAQTLSGKITRKVVKQTVMTNVYGVTMIGARRQILRQLVAAHPDLPNTRACNPGLLATYVTKKVFTALADMFKGAHDIQYWFGECAGRISQCITPQQIAKIQNYVSRKLVQTTPGAGPKQKRATRRTSRNTSQEAENATTEDLLRFQTSVIWTTPLRMPVVQPYRVQKSKSISTHLQNLMLREPRRNDAVLRRKQLQAFPPNFIHSLDATHMLLSALECDRRGLSFAAVHDSFWTHASDIPVMNEVLRKAFIRIHSQDIVGRLASEFKTRYGDCIHWATFQPQSAVAKRIAEWRKNERSKMIEELGPAGAVLQRKSKMAELLLEYKRMSLLKSDDPEEVKQGQAMVTPGSIFIEMSAEQDVEAPGEILGLGLNDTTGQATTADSDEIVEDGEEDIDVDVDEVMDAPLENAESDKEVTQELSSVRRTSPHFAKAMSGSRATTQVAKESAWVPWTLPPLPEKGTWNVSRTSQSEYFFS